MMGEAGLFVIFVALMFCFVMLQIAFFGRRKAEPSSSNLDTSAQGVDTAQTQTPSKTPYRKLGALGCVWYAVAPHLSYTIPTVLLVSLAHGWFLIDWAEQSATAQEAELQSRPFYWVHESIALPSILMNVSPTIAMMLGWLWHGEYWGRDNPDLLTQVQAAMDTDNKILPTPVVVFLIISGFIYVVAVPFAVFVLSQEFHRLFH